MLKASGSSAFAAISVGGSPPSTASPAGIPVLGLLDVQSHSEEEFSRNGLTKVMHIVVKGSPFHLLVGCVSGRPLNFAKVAFRASLHYDCDEFKSVDFVKVEPLEFKYAPNASGDRLEVELRIKVLTSQHEDMLFKVHIQGVDPTTRADIPGLALFTPPIKVISKPEQLKKRQPSKKRSATDAMLDTIKRIESRQDEQTKLLERLCRPQSHGKSVKEELIADSPAQEFDNCFARLLTAFTGMRPEERAACLRNAVGVASASDIVTLQEMLDMFSSEGLRREPTLLAPAMSTEASECHCASCPHKLELQRVDEFYQRFLENGVGSVSGGTDLLGLTLDHESAFASYVSFS